MSVCISNPPYNMKWGIPDFAQIQPRFAEYGVPPESNANYAFVLTAMSECERVVIILPGGVLTSNASQEAEIRKTLVDKNKIEAVISCPDGMFEATSIPVCVLVLNNNKNTATTRMIDLRQKYEVEIREQKGQFGGASHKNRVYKKEVKVFSAEIIEDVLKQLCSNENIGEYCKTVTIEDIKNQGYLLVPSRYIDFCNEDPVTRSYEDIIADINDTIREKNACKLTMNETIARGLGLSGFADAQKAARDNSVEINKSLQCLAMKIESDDYFSLTKNKGEVEFKNNAKDRISSVLMMIFQTWRQHIYFLNEEENRYLVELRDKLLPDLMSGKIKLDGSCVPEEEDF